MTTALRGRIVDNPHSFRGPYPVTRVRPTFAAAGWDVDVVHRQPGVSGPALVADALADGVQLLIAAGGDGTLRDVASAAAGTPLEVGLLPGGTANVLARELGISLRPEWAARQLVGGEVRRLDLGRLSLPDGRWARFCLAAGLGLDGLALRSTDAALKRSVGPLAIGLGLARAIPRARRFEARLTVDGQPAWEGRTWQLLVSNASHYAVALRPSPDARPDDGWLDLAVVTADRPWPLARMGRSLLWRGVPDPAGARWFRGRSFQLDVDGPLAGQLDGSPLVPLVDGRVRLAVEPGALQARLPRP